MIYQPADWLLNYMEMRLAIFMYTELEPKGLVFVINHPLDFELDDDDGC